MKGTGGSGGRWQGEGEPKGAVAERARLSAFARATELGEPLDAELAWHTLEARLRGERPAREKPPRRRWLALPALATAGVAAVIAVVAWRGHGPALEVGHAIESADAEVALALPDGIQVDMDRRSSVRLESLGPEEIRVGLGKGSARFDVEPHRPRQFVVDADDVEIRVVGTRFRVTRFEAVAGARIEVDVERGVVEVRDRVHGGETRRLRAGERLSLPATSEAPAPTDEAATDEPAPAPRPPVRRHDKAGASAPTRLPGKGSEASDAAATTPRALLERGQHAWRAGRMNDAADLYEEILTRFPTDVRAGLAAFELGRIQMDHLGDAASAVANFERALRLAPRAGFHEDTLARLAQAQDRLGHASECRRVRARYLREYPNGIHAPGVAGLCP